MRCTIYDADIRIGSDYLRFYYTDFMEFIDPIQVMAYEDSIMHNHDDCHYQDLMKHKMTYAWNYFTATNQIANSRTEMKQFVYDGIVTKLGGREILEKSSYGPYAENMKKYASENSKEIPKGLSGEGTSVSAHFL